jgi:DNA-binding NtrC family response regulator
LVAGPIPGTSPVEIVEVVHGADRQMPVVIVDREMTAAQAVRLIRNGAHHCFGGTDSVEGLRQCLHQACDEKTRREKLRDRMPAAADLEQWIVGESRAIEDVLNTIRLIGPRRCTVLITGETGTGKEMAARALHLASPRASLPMVAVNCSALPENLLEAELFGHVKGAFTGATNHRVGRFEQAHRSTIFLDEIGEMPIELQTKLLRVLQEREIQRLGSSETIRVDVRVVAASNCDLLEKVRQGKFREDLYYRLNVVPLAMPPLRQRRGDIPMLVDHFLAKICRNEDIPVKHVTPETKERLCALPWPGNVRQLENMVEMAVALSGDREILGPADLGLAPSFKVVPMELPGLPTTLPESMDFDTVVGHFERSILEQALTKTGGNKTAAAELLGLKRTTLIMKLRGLQYSQPMLERAG